ncbi:MAG: hypothetical protein KDE55_03940 [Novosphingobium sp.]|nr:hypothetical protein [Novosphingobium sp.]
MTGTGAKIAGSTAAQDVASDWQSVHDAGDIQFAPLPPAKPPETPDWLKTLGEWLRGLLEPLGNALGLSWPVVEKVLIALAILLALFILWRLLGPLIGHWRQRALTAEPEWAPDRQAAIALLEDADRLASEGRFGEAVHLLLQRSVGHIADTRPDWLQPASTAREIAAIPMLPDRARHAFTEIAVRVERSLFALRDLEAADWHAARAAYSDFALADLAS